VAEPRLLKWPALSYDAWTTASDEEPALSSALPPVPPRPDLATGAWPPLRAPLEPPRRRFPRWVVGSAVLTVVMLVSAAVTSYKVRYDPDEHRDEYAFIDQGFGGDPVRWNPCEPVHYVVNVADAPPGSIGDVQEAVRRISAVTGIAFTYEGLTDEELERQRDVVQQDRYGDRWAPVLVTWVHPDESSISFHSDGEIAAGVATPFTPPGSDVIVSGWIAINADDPNLPGFDSPDSQGPIVLHEWGHVMGLDHVEESGQLMHPSGGGVSDFGPGDVEGLRRVGRSEGCLETPAAP
jgi:hypothetical protein